MTKTCENPTCGREFGPRPGRSAADWAARKYCSRVCSGRGTKKAIVDPIKVCENRDCGKEFGPTKGRGAAAWAVRRFCSQKCAMHIRKGTIIEDVAWIIDHDHPESVAKRVGYGKVSDLINKLGRLGANDLAEKLSRNLERYQMGAA